MRRRILFVAFGAVVLATVAANFWPVQSVRDHYRSSSSLSMSVLARTEGALLVSVKNSGNQQFEMLEGVLIEYLDPGNPEGYIPSEYHTLANSRFKLLPGATFQAMCVGPSKHLKWRAHIGGVGQREVALKTKMRQALNWTVILRRYPLTIYPEYAQTDWIAP